MPRPGPRPYECVRRAWHSDRHRPVRGSIIQQIFRLVNEAHSSATKKNREWQEKLPIVVFKAEQIIYSKANSEAEYLTSDTLWDRVNDAINTIIRRDESTETGELLPPCVEAALNLGCVPVRASRSQRHSNPRNYLSPRTPEHASTPSRVFDNSGDESSPHRPNNHLKFSRPVTVMNSPRPVTESSSHGIYPFLYENIPPIPSGHNQLTSVDNNTPRKCSSVYPLYYGTQHQTEEPPVVPTIPENAEPNTIFFGTPICPSVLEPAEMGMNSISTRAGIQSVTNRDTCEILPGTQCDLSLRLGLLPNPYLGVEESFPHETEHVSRVSVEGGEFCFFPRKLADKSFQSCPMRFFPVDEGLNLERKRKSPFGNHVEDGEYRWHSELTSNRFMSHVKGSGL